MKKLTPKELTKLSQLVEDGKITNNELAEASLEKELNIRKAQQQINVATTKFDTILNQAVSKDKVRVSILNDFVADLNEKYGISEYNPTTGEIIPRVD